MLAGSGNSREFAGLLRPQPCPMILNAKTQDSKRNSTILNNSLRSFSGGDSALMSSRDENYWQSQVKKLMSEKRKANEKIKDRNSEIRQVYHENQKLSQALKYKQSLIDQHNIERMLA